MPTLERRHFFARDGIRPVPSPEELSLCDALLAWRAIHAEGRLRPDPSKQVHLGTIGSWAEWSGSAWVDARKRLIQKNGVKCIEAHLHCSFPPWTEPRTDEHLRIIRDYGHWVSDFQWEPPREWPDDAKETLEKLDELRFNTMTTRQVMIAWRAIYSDGGLSMNTMRYVPGVHRPWCHWAGSELVARLDQLLKEDASVVASDFRPHLAFPPRWEIRDDGDREIVRKYGRWVTETEWRSPDQEVDHAAQRSAPMPPPTPAPQPAQSVPQPQAPAWKVWGWAAVLLAVGAVLGSLLP